MKHLTHKILLLVTLLALSLPGYRVQAQEQPRQYGILELRFIYDPNHDGEYTNIPHDTLINVRYINIHNGIIYQARSDSFGGKAIQLRHALYYFEAVPPRHSMAYRWVCEQEHEFRQEYEFVVVLCHEVSMITALLPVIYK